MTTTDRRSLVLGLGTATMLGATAGRAAAPAAHASLAAPLAAAGGAATIRAAPLDDATLMHTFMKMGNGPGNTLQNGRGGKVERPEDLPPDLLRLTKQIHPDLIANGAAVLAG